MIYKDLLIVSLWITLAWAEPSANFTPPQSQASQHVLQDDRLFASSLDFKATFDAAFKLDTSSWVTNVKDDPFYQTPSIFPHGIQGSVLRHEVVKGAQFATYTSLNPSIAFHRILYESKNFKGDPVPIHPSVPSSGHTARQGYSAPAHLAINRISNTRGWDL
ncbi:hypothetical protein M422DRAFT_247472 [Sphaerobolus stellatus SS14]|nr:hypothetical protein M422DRAFT_247472 [Sphaerobolus stellatus SS14]